MSGSALSLPTQPKKLLLSAAIAAALVAGPALRAQADEMKTAAVGEKAPAFSLVDTDGKTHVLADYTKAGKVVVLEWFNPDCPVVKAYHEKTHRMTDTQKKWGEKVVWIAVNSGAAGMQGNGLDRNKQARTDYAMAYPVVLDEAGTVGMAYGAKTTPHMFIIGADGTLLYKGSLDESADATKAGANYVDAALTSLFAGKKIAMAETKSFGCSVKYAPKS